MRPSRIEGVPSTDSGGGDFGLFGPGSMAWRLHREPAMLVGGLRALIVQALHPLAIAAVVDHSDYKKDVWGRYARTSNYVVTTIFGTTRQAQALGGRVQAIHRPIHGTDRVTGRPYAADDPVLLLWIHTTLVESFLAAYRRFVGPLTAAEADRYVGEMVRQAELVGLKPQEVPSTATANQAFVESLRPELVATKHSFEALDTVLHPPLPPWRRPVWWVAGQATVSVLPDHAVELYGLRRNPAAEAAVRPLVSSGSQFARRFLRPPHVLREARRRAAAEGYSV
jgi:uncharacterized protein (DUF2236 family)